MDYHTKAIILKTQKLSDSDKILSLYSPEHGLIKAVAKSAYKINSGFGAKSGVLNLGNFLLAKGRNLDIIREIKIENTFRNIRSDYLCLSFAFFMVDLLENIAIKDENYTEPFSLLKSSLEAMDREIINPNSDKDHTTFTHALNFNWKLIEFLGYKPELNYCSLTQRQRHVSQIPEYFDFENGSITSKEAYGDYTTENPYDNHIRAINKSTFKILDLMDQNLDINSSPEPFTNDALASAIKLLHKHLEYRVHKEFKSWRVLEPALSII